MKLYTNTTSPYARIVRIALWEKGFENIDIQILDPWADAPEFLAANPAARVPALVCDDGRALTESLLIVLWLEGQRPEPSLLAGDATAIVSQAGTAMGVIDAATQTIINQKTISPSFLGTPVGLRRRRTMVEGLKRLDVAAADYPGGVPSLAAITAVVALDYVQFRFPQAEWLPALAKLTQLQQRLRARPSVSETLPHDQK